MTYYARRDRNSLLKQAGASAAGGAVGGFLGTSAANHMNNHYGGHRFSGGDYGGYRGYDRPMESGYPTEVAMEPSRSCNPFGFAFNAISELMSFLVSISVLVVAIVLIVFLGKKLTK